MKSRVDLSAAMCPERCLRLSRISAEAFNGVVAGLDLVVMTNESIIPAHNSWTLRWISRRIFLSVRCTMRPDLMSPGRIRGHKMYMPARNAKIFRFAEFSPITRVLCDFLGVDRPLQFGSPAPGGTHQKRQCARGESHALKWSAQDQQ